MLEWAGKAAFERGRGYHAGGRVVLSKVAGAALIGNAHGTETYRLWLKREGGDWQWACDCPAADGGAFCKHLVAAVLTARDEVEGEEARPSSKSSKRHAAPARKDELLAFLRTQPAARLAGWLHALAGEDGDIEKRLLLYRAAEQPDTLKPAFAKLLNTGGFLDYRRAIDYARRLDAAIEQLRNLLQRDPDGCRALCEYALGRLFKIYGNSDDSAGAIGDCLHSIAELHAQACAASPPGAALAKPLHAMQCKDEWDVLALPDYWDALGLQGQGTYAKLVMAEFERLPAPKPDEHFGEGFDVCRRVESLARCAGDFELLQRVLRRNLSHSYDHLRVLESLREFGREREALAWAEDAVKKFPADVRLRNALAECLADAGMEEEALEQAWQGFQGCTTETNWDVLKRLAGKAWPAWRARALELLAARENGEVSRRIQFLMHDHDLAGALKLARDNRVAIHVLVDLAAAVERSEPAAAGAFFLRAAQALNDGLNSASDYKRLVSYLKAASKLLSRTGWKPAADRVRALHHRKPKLMGMLDKAGL
ncbi:MAG TPA: SWIM zinc finger family protein [Terracidiphilus sp.]|nr:SWIM zinc finger family protein [Terracidiphilus sp.]